MNAVSKIEPQTLASAMALAFAEIEGATKTTQGQVGQQKYKYADLTSVIDAIKPALINHGLLFTQRPQPSENGVTVTTMLHHACGEWLELGTLFVPANKNDAQGFGSALTYARRYALVTAFGVPVEDDDGNAASKGGQSQVGAVSSPAPSEMPDAEWAKLANLIKATSSKIGDMTKHYGVANLRHLNIDQYAEAIGHLNTKLAKMAKEETDKKAAASNLAEELADEIAF